LFYTHILGTILFAWPCPWAAEPMQISRTELTW